MRLRGGQLTKLFGEAPLRLTSSAPPPVGEAIDWLLLLVKSKERLPLKRELSAKLTEELKKLSPSMNANVTAFFLVLYITGAETASGCSKMKAGEG